MKNETRKLVLGRLWPLLNRHWFKIGLVALATYAILSKDLSFNISIQAPEEPLEIPEEELQSRRQSRRETLTDNSATTAQTTSRFDFLPSWGENPDAAYLLLMEKTERRDIQQFIKRFSHVAEAEQEKYGMPASIILARGLLQSLAGQHPAVEKGHNYFLLPCTDDWEGQTQDGERGTCLRRYDNAWMSFRDNSLYLTSGENGHLRRLKGADHREWAEALQHTKGNDNDQLAKQLLNVIREFGLDKFDD